jgi:hypothetical protein
MKNVRLKKVFIFATAVLLTTIVHLSCVNLYELKNSIDMTQLDIQKSGGR